MDEWLSVSEAAISLCGHQCGILVMFYLGSAGATCSRCSDSHRDHWCLHTHESLVFLLDLIMVTLEHFLRHNPFWLQDLQSGQGTQYRASLKQVFDCLTNKELTSFWHQEWYWQIQSESKLPPPVYSAIDTRNERKQKLWEHQNIIVHKTLRRV